MWVRMVLAVLRAWSLLGEAKEPLKKKPESWEGQGQGLAFPRGSCSHLPPPSPAAGPGGPPLLGGLGCFPGSAAGAGARRGRGALRYAGVHWGVLGCTGVHWGAGPLLALGHGLVQDALCGPAACRLSAPSIRLSPAHGAWGLSSIVNSIRVSFSGLLV